MNRYFGAVLFVLGVALLITYEWAHDPLSHAAIGIFLIVRGAIRWNES